MSEKDRYDLVLINPPQLVSRTVRPSYTNEPNMGIAYLLAVCKRAGYKVAFIDAHTRRLDLKGLRAELESHPARVVGITAHTSIVKSAAATAALAKSIDPSIITVIGGYHVSVLPEQTLREFPAFDVGVVGEGENTLIELLAADGDRKRFEQIEGLVLRDGERIATTVPRPFIDDLDTLPFPDWSSFPLGSYTPHYSYKKNIIELPVNTGRGCIGRCAICARVTGPVLRRRSVESVLTEIGEDIARHGANAIVFMDESFTADPELIAEVCEGILERGYQKKMYWLCLTRVDCVNARLLELMARAGCRHISYGIESGNQELLDGIGKAITLQQIKDAVHDAQAARILVDNFFILGLPGETPASIRETIRLAKELDSDWANFFILAPYPGTKIYEMAKLGEGGLRLISDDWDDYGIQMGKALELEDLPRAQLERWQLRAYMAFYLRPRKVKNMIRIVNIWRVPAYFANMLHRSAATSRQRTTETHG